MGENFSASDSSWKKMVIAKTNNEWISTIKSEQNNAEIPNTANFSLEESYGNVKIERVDNVEDNAFENVEPVNMMQEIDPLMLEASKRRRRKGSGPKSETPEERATRLAKMSAYAAQRLANETPDQRALRLKRMSEYAARRLAQETSEQRAKRLARMSAYAAKRLAEETPEQRRMRLARMSAYAARRQAMKKEATMGATDGLESTSNFNQAFINSVMPNQS